MVDDNTRTPSIGWVRQHVSQQIESLAGVIGGEVGEGDKRLRDYTDQQVTLLIKMIEGQQQRIAALETQQSAGRAAAPARRKRP